jgi:hypothetical protein
MKRSVSSTIILLFNTQVANALARLRCAPANVHKPVALSFAQLNCTRYLCLVRSIRAVRITWRVGATAIIFIVAVIGAWPGHARAALVSGVLTGYENSTPLVSRDLHFQNVITGDVYLSPTHSDGSFRASVPPGSYRLRTETGAVLVDSIMVGRDNIDLGRVNELAPLAPQRWWQSQVIAPTRLAAPAPSTAYLMTSDKTPLPATATAVPKPEIDWSKMPPETQASQGRNTVTGMATAPLPPLHTPSTAMPAEPGGMGAAPYSAPPTATGVYPPMR